MLSTEHNVIAGRNVTITATGSGATGADGHATDGDIVAHGTQISGQNVTLDAARDINLESAKDTTQLTSSNSSGSFGVGAGVNLGGSQNGVTIELSASGAKGFANGTSTTNRDTQVSASNALTMTSGRDTTLAGAEVSGNTVTADVGRNLTIASQQDAANYDNKQGSAGFSMSICVPPICYGQTVSGSVSASGQSITNSFSSVNQQSGIYAGNGGFNVNVGNHTQLDGGVISSTATPDKNTLTTQSFDFTNLENHADYSGVALGAKVSYSGPNSKSASTDTSTSSKNNNLSKSPVGFSAGVTGDSASGTTYAAVSPGTIVVRDDALTGQDSTAGLSRDPSTANGSVQNQFNEQNVQTDLQVQQGVEQVTMQAVNAVNQTKEYNAQDAQKIAQDQQAVEDARQSLDDAVAKGNDDKAAGQDVQADKDAAQKAQEKLNTAKGNLKKSINSPLPNDDAQQKAMSLFTSLLSGDTSAPQKAQTATSAAQTALSKAQASLDTAKKQAAAIRAKSEADGK